MRGERISPVHLHFSGGTGEETMTPRFADAVFQSARILENQKTPLVKETVRKYQPEPPPSIELFYASKDGTDGVSVTILLHQTGPSVILYSKSSKAMDPTPINHLTIPKVLEKLCIGYDNKYSYFTIPNVEKNCRIY